MDAPNAPNPSNPNAQGNPDQNQDQGQDQDQVPAGEVPPPMPANQYHNWLLLVLHLFLKLYIKIG